MRETIERKRVDARMTFEEFLAAELEALRRYARLLAGDRDTAHDVLAEALIKAHLRWSRIRQVEFPAAYVRAMVTNCYLSEKRRWLNQVAREARAAGLPETMVASSGRAVDDRDQLDQLLRTLPKQQRAAIVLRYYLDIDDREIATELHCSAGAVRTYISRGLATLRERGHEVEAPPGGAPSKPPKGLRTTMIGEAS